MERRPTRKQSGRHGSAAPRSEDAEAVRRAELGPNECGRKAYDWGKQGGHVDPGAFLYAHFAYSLFAKQTVDDLVRFFLSLTWTHANKFQFSNLVLV